MPDLKTEPRFLQKKNLKRKRNDDEVKKRIEQGQNRQKERELPLEGRKECLVGEYGRTRKFHHLNEGYSPYSHSLTSSGEKYNQKPLLAAIQVNTKKSDAVSRDRKSETSPSQKKREDGEREGIEREEDLGSGVRGRAVVGVAAGLFESVGGGGGRGGATPGERRGGAASGGDVALLPLRDGVAPERSRPRHPHAPSQREHRRRRR